MIIKIYWGNYSFNSRTKQLTRLKAGMGTWPGRVIAPWRDHAGRERQYFSPCVKGKKYLTSISKLMQQAGRKEVRKKK